MIGRWSRVRIASCAIVLGVVSLAVVRRAFELQVRESAALTQIAADNYIREIQLPARRGRILDRNGKELAATTEVDSVACNPRQLTNIPEAARKLAVVVGLDAKELTRSLTAKKSQYFAWVRRRVTPDQAVAAMALGIPGVRIEKEARRVYPKKELAATVLGHAGSDGVGLDGVERAFDRVLRGSGMQMVTLRDARGRELLVNGSVDQQATAGSDLMLSLDEYLTHVADKVLAETVAKHRAVAATAIIMDPQTGEVLALSNVPTYNPNDPRNLAARQVRNRALTDWYEPGSTMKTFTFAAAFNEGVVRPTDLFDCLSGSRLKVGRHEIKDDHPKGVITAAEVLKYSSNIGTVKIARKVGKESLHAMFKKFGFGKRTGVGLGERAGILHDPKRWGEIEFANNSFGQGLTATPLQMVAAYAAIASGGMYRPPRLALKIVHPDGRSERVPRPAGARGEERIMKEGAARLLLNIMQAVTEDGTATQAAIPGYPVAGKTGTAQKVENGRYVSGKYMPNFIGIVPADRPRLVIAVIVDEPASPTEYYGGQVAAPAFKQIAEAALSYLGVAPSLPILTKKDGKDGKKPVPSMADNDVPIEIPFIDLREPPEPAVAEGAEGAGDMAAEDDATRIEIITVPDFTGLSMGEAIRVARRAGVEIAPLGSGIAVAQTVKPGTVARGVCQVSFRPRG